MAKSTTERLAAYQTRYSELASQLADIGFIAAGSITHRYTRCASPGCRCNAEPPKPHGPYYQWTAKMLQGGFESAVGVKVPHHHAAAVAVPSKLVRSRRVVELRCD